MISCLEPRADLRSARQQSVIGAWMEQLVPRARELRDCSSRAQPHTGLVSHRAAGLCAAEASGVPQPHTGLVSWWEIFQLKICLTWKRRRQQRNSSSTPTRRRTLSWPHLAELVLRKETDS